MTNNPFAPPNHSDCYHQPAGSCIKEQKCKIGQLRLGVFFDGTGNDQHNPAEYTNVKKLFDVYEVSHNKKRFEANDRAYIRGVGSRSLSDNNHSGKPFTPDDFQGDGTTGGAFGVGGLARIDHMVYELQEAIKRYKSNMGCLPKTVFFDVFGFSRGAVQARHFVNVLKQGFYKLDGLYDYTPKDFHIATLNVFDSVASFNALSVLKPNDIVWDSSPKDYGWAFYINPVWVGKIVHLVADDEYRQNFDGQYMDEDQDREYPTDTDNKNITEILCLGAHSDIGGGYLPRAHGRNTNDLAKIYLNQMYDLADANGVPLTKKPENNAWDVSESLKRSYNRIQEYYKKYPNLKIAHKKFRERMAYLYDPDTNKHPPYLGIKDTKAAISANDKANKAQQIKVDKLRLKHKKLKYKRYTIGTKSPREQRLELVRDIRRQEHQIHKRKKENKGYQHMLNAFNDLKVVFTASATGATAGAIAGAVISGSKANINTTADTDYQAFIDTWLNFHNSYVHKSHSGLLKFSRTDYDADGKPIPIDENKPELQKRISESRAKITQLDKDYAALQQQIRQLYNLDNQQLAQRYQGKLKGKQTQSYHLAYLREIESNEIIRKQAKNRQQKYTLKHKIKDYQKQIASTEYRKRDKAGMDAEIDGNWFGYRYLHRDWYYKQHIDVLAELKSQNSLTRKMEKQINPVLKAYRESTEFQWALPKKLKTA